MMGSSNAISFVGVAKRGACCFGHSAALLPPFNWRRRRIAARAQLRSAVPAPSERRHLPLAMLTGQAPIRGLVIAAGRGNPFATYMTHPTILSGIVHSCQAVCVNAWKTVSRGGSWTATPVTEHRTRKKGWVATQKGRLHA